MRINYLQLKNFRQYKDMKIEFKKNDKGDLHIFIANNGSGKTNIMNAISWCLYQRDLDGHQRKDKLPDFNLRAAKEAEEAGEDHIDISVEVQIESCGEVYTITRMQHVVLPSEFAQKPSLKIIYQKKGETKIIEGDNQQKEADEIIQDILPQAISQYSFFDGETLQNYFNDNKNSSVKDAINKMAQINVVKDAENHLDNLIKDKEIAASKLDPDIDYYKKKLDKDIESKNQYDTIISELLNNISFAEKRKRELDQAIAGNEHISDIDAEKKRTENLLEDLKVDAQKFTDELNAFFRKSYIELALKDTLQEVNRYINEKSEYLPVKGFSQEMLERCLDDDECQLCHSHLTKQAQNIIQQLLRRYELAPVGTQTLLKIQPQIESMCHDINLYSEKEREFNQKDIDYKKKINSLEDQKAELESRLNQVSNVEDIEAWIKERRLHEDSIKHDSEKKGEYVAQLNELRKSIEKDQKDLETAEKANIQQNTLYSELNFMRRARNVLGDVEREIVGEIRDKTTAETKKYFDELAYKTQTFGNISIDENYQLTVYHKQTDPNGKMRSMLGSLSAAEKELLALAFTLAILKVSGYDSMLVIDTPVGRVDDNNRRNFAHCLVEVSKKKQLILFFTKTEYDSEIAQEFDPVAATNKRIQMSSNEEESLLED